MSNKKQLKFKCMSCIPFLTFLVLIVSPAISTAVTSQPSENTQSIYDDFLSPDKHRSIIKTASNKNRLKNYGPVNNNEGLWEIAAQLSQAFEQSTSHSPELQVTIPQIAVALFDKNPEAFIKQNINGLLVGSTLKVPDLQQIHKLAEADAFDLFLQHWDVWQGVKSEIVLPNPIDTNELTRQKDESEQITNQISSEELPVIIPEETIESTIQTTAITPAILPALVEPAILEPEQITSQISNEELPVIVPEETIESTIQTTAITPAILPALVEPAILEPTQTNQPITKQKSDKVYSSFMDQIPNINFNQNLVGAINWFQSNLNLSNVDIKNLPDQFSSTSVKIALVSLLFIIFLIWLSKREESEVIEIKSNPSNKKENILLLENNEFQSTKTLKLEQATLLEEKERPEETESFEERDVYSGNIIPNQIDLDTPINQGEKKEKHNSKNMLEAAFADNIISSCNNFVPEDIQTEQKIQAETLENQSTETLLTDSVDEIRFVNEETTSSKIDAFLDATQAETLSDEMLSHDFDNIINSDKIDIFIQEFEEVMSNLSSHAPAVTRTPNDLDNLLQYKLSIHFIKVLSEMMQATYLKQFSTTIIEFLEDVLDGKTKMTADTTDRLIIVVSFYSRYIHSIKKQNTGKLEA